MYMFPADINSYSYHLSLRQGIQECKNNVDMFASRKLQQETQLFIQRVPFGYFLYQLTPERWNYFCQN